MSYRDTVNKQLANYWKSCKKDGTFTYKSVNKKTHPQFTRHNGSRLVRLNTGWRYPRSTQGNRSTITKPLIGYRNPANVRHCLKAYGKRIGVVYTQNQLGKAVAEGCIPVLGRTLGARSRIRLLAYARAQNLPIMLRR